MYAVVVESKEVRQPYNNVKGGSLWLVCETMSFGDRTVHVHVRPFATKGAMTYVLDLETKTFADQESARKWAMSMPDQLPIAFSGSKIRPRPGKFYLYNLEPRMVQNGWTAAKCEED